MTITENSKITLALAGGLMVGALSAQALVLTRLNSTLTREEAERAYVRQDVLAEQLKFVNSQLGELSGQFKEMRRDLTEVQLAVRAK